VVELAVRRSREFGLTNSDMGHPTGSLSSGVGGGGLFQGLHGPHLHLLDVVRLPPQRGVAQVGWGCNGQIEQACGQVLN
jgi:hypothetical protein